MFWYKFWVNLRAVGLVGAAAGALAGVSNASLQIFYPLDPALHGFMGQLSPLLFLLSMMTIFAAE